MPQQQDRLLHVIVIGIAAVLAAAVVMLILDRRDGPQPLQITPGQAGPDESGPIEVYITGAVVSPGVYEMHEGDRVVDLLAEAGGHTPDADLEAVNLALKLHDEDQVIVPRQGETTADVGGGSSDVLGFTGPVNINTASRHELADLLPGIGEVYSRRIVDSRETDGPFRDVDDLLIRGLIPQSTFENIRDLITVGP